MRVLFTSRPALGHVHPMLPLARAALAAGHDVVIATGPDLRSHVDGLGFETWAVGPSSAQADAAFRAAHPEADSLAPHHKLPLICTGLFGASALHRAADLVPRATSWAPDLVVHEPTEFAGAVAAIATGARHAVHGFGQMPAMFGDLLALGMRRLAERWALPNLAAAVFSAPFLDICPPSLSPRGQVFATTVPLRPSAGERSDIVPLSTVDNLYLTLGTVFNERPDLFRTVLAGLNRLRVPVVVTIGPGVDPSALGAQPNTVRVERYLPQASVLPHCRAVVSHGGSGTMLGALAHGLPQLCLPQGADQFVNAGAVAAAGAGLAIQPAELTSGAVAEAVGRLLGEPEFCLSARKIQADIDAMPSPPDVLARLLR
jgi:UDP:flavonoid glycosyltransferase YjiC (YdhE family)